MTSGAAHREIVVGVDGSSASKAALAWAVEEARFRGCGVVALHAWQFPVLGFGGYGGTVVPLLTPEDLEKVAFDTVTAAVDEVVGDDLSVPVEVRVLQGHPAGVLLEAGKTADLLVLGSEGHGAFTGMLLGSVSMQVVHHAPCAVTIVRPDWKAS
jgi:nucleotide-binding universal stress UspA family protein